MKALILNGPNQKFSIENIKDPIPKKGYAVAKVLACGSGLTIQHVKKGRIKANFPIIMVIIVAEIVEVVTIPTKNWHVTAYFYLTCGDCKWCN